MTGAMLSLIASAVLVAQAAAGAGAGTASVPLRIHRPLMVTQLPPSPNAEAASDRAYVHRLASFGHRARIVLILPDGAPRVLTPGFHSACDPSLSFDAARFLFAGKRLADDSWNIFEAQVDGSGIRQVTRDLGNCRSPSYQSSHYQISENEPWYQITFVRDDPALLNENSAGARSNIYSCKLDGSLARRLTYNLSSDYDPTLLDDGRLVYASWQRSHVNQGEPGRVSLLEVNQDGTDYAPFAVQSGKRFKHMPCSTPSGSAIFVESDRMPWDGAGQLACVSLVRPLHTYRSLTGRADGLFHSPSALPDGRILSSRRPADGSGTHGVFVLDVDSPHPQLVLDDPQYHDIQAIVVAPRREPDGRSSSMVDSDPVGKLYCLSVYNSDLQGAGGGLRGKATSLRVLEGVEPTRTDADAWGTMKGFPQLAQRRILGEIRLEEDGSFSVEVPANTPLELQLLDDEGLALRTCSWIWTRNHFSQGCVGCHEDPELTPDNQFISALQHPAAQASPPPEARKFVEFGRDVMPLVESKCLPCHRTGGSVPILATEPKADPTAVYRLLLGSELPAADRTVPYVDPGRARTSRLVWHAFGRNTSRPWDGPIAEIPAKPIPPGNLPPLTESERLTLVRWIDLGARYEGAGFPAVPRRGHPESGTKEE